MTRQIEQSGIRASTREATTSGGAGSPSERHAPSLWGVPRSHVSRAHAGQVLVALALLGAGCGRDRTALQAGVAVDAGTSNGTPDAGVTEPGDAGRARSSQKLVILHTNDIHSHLMGFGPERDYTPATINDDGTRGGIARLATAIGRARASAVRGHGS